MTLTNAPVMDTSGLLSGCALTSIGIVGHWMFRTGRGLRSHNYRGRVAHDILWPLVIRTFYGMLPGACGFGVMTVAMTVPAWGSVLGDGLARRLVIAGLCLSLACMVWMFKELAYPSRFRTPGWLKDEVGGV